jgi:DNA-binding response OmpR family regulator
LKQNELQIESAAWEPNVSRLWYGYWANIGICVYQNYDTPVLARWFLWRLLAVVLTFLLALPLQTKSSRYMKILIVEDDSALLRLIEEFLLSEKYVVEKAASYHAACDKTLMYDYDCILLDVTLPDGNGIDLLKELKKERRQANVIIISARNALDDKIRGLDFGADDYLTKPFHLAELHARIKAVFRRKQQEGQQFTEIGNTRVDFFNREVTVGNEALSLNRKEFDMLSFFVNNAGKLITKESVAEYVWGDHVDMADNFDFVYSQMKNLRRKLKAVCSSLEIENVYGVGYKLTLPPV